MATGWDSDYRYEPDPLFQQTLVCLPFSKYKSPHLQTGDKIVMPPSSLDQIYRLPLRFPWTFKIQTFISDRVSHCGILEFESEEGYVHMPDWMMDNLNIAEGDRVILRDASLPKGWLIKLQPHTMSFTQVPDPRAVLECNLRAFTCLSKGDTIMLKYGEKEFYFDVLRVEPGEAVCLIDTDCDLDLVMALDYVEPEPLPPPPAVEERGEENKVFVPFTGKGRRLDGKSVSWSENDVVVGMSRLEDEDGGKEKLFKAFTGRGRILG